MSLDINLYTSVLILVLMEDRLIVSLLVLHNVHLLAVLILVLMEDRLIEDIKDQMKDLID